MFKVMWASWNQSYLELCDYDTGKLAVHYGWCRVGMGLCQIVTNPIYSAISDSVGRKGMMTWGRFGWMFFFYCHRFRDTSLTHRLLMEWFCWGVVQVRFFPVFLPFSPVVPISPPFFGQTGVWPTFAASHSDVFGTRPELYSRIQAADNMYVNFISMLGGPATTAITLAFGNIHAAQPIAGVLATLSMLVVFTIPETLKPERRKPLEWGKLLGRANPLSNLMLLMNKGSGLRRLSISASLQ